MKSLSFLRRPAVIVPLEMADAPIVHRLHRQAFYHGWGVAAFQNFLNDPHIIGFGARLNSRSAGERHFSGFILARLIDHEAEILTFAVAKNYRRAGLGRALLEYLLRFLYQERAEILFLEADEHNSPALALYRSLGFRESGRRKAYYQSPAADAALGGAAPGRSDAILFEYRLERPAAFSQSR